MRNTKHQKPNTKETPTINWSALSYLDGARSGGFVLNDGEVNNGKHPFDFEERTAVFGEGIVRFAKRIPRGPDNDRLINQIVGAGTSVGANFCEANDCVSKKDFRYIAKRCIKEAKETRFFLRMIAASEPSLAADARDLYREATELIRILATMCRK
jgi:four helix bundle protein